MAKTLREAMPREFGGGEHAEDRAQKFAGVEVLKEFKSTKPSERWPGKHKNVFSWVALANGYAVGWNESPGRGWSLPVVQYRPDKVAPPQKRMREA
uniref:Uncharacterized protein n=1 Tax=Pseudomonas fluorescens (strain SBW25) TaxID=216595 RepID=A0A0G4E5R6_PSEFS|nr:hypothetical protein [Pseudomonas fluorescens]CEK42312.1 hypothetical protein PQBR57_0359 [Pseudomonas fluorescens SBW25]